MDFRLSAAGLVVGFLVGMSGMGGAVFITPTLILLGMRPTLAIGTDLVYAAATKVAGAWQHWRQGTADVKLALRFSVGSVPGSLAGVCALNVLRRLNTEVAETFATRAVAIAILVAAVMILVSRLRWINGKDPAPAVAGRPVSQTLVLAVGFGIGLLVGVTSVGSGTLMAPVFLLMCQLSPQRTVGTDLVHGALLVFTAGLGHTIVGNVDFLAVCSLLVGSIPGVLLGSRAALRIPREVLGFVMAALLLLLGVKLF